MSATSPKLPVSVIIPVYNEEPYLGQCLDALACQDYPLEEVEVLVVDGRSTDRSREIALERGKKFPHFKLLINEKKTAPTALNLGIGQSQGDYIIRVDARSWVARDFIRKNMEALASSDAALIGGVVKTQGQGFWGRCLACILSSPFGVGNAYFHYSQKPRYVDTVNYGAHRRRIFDQIGLFNERLTRNQDMEFSTRLRRAGEKIWLTPEIVSYYQCRSSLRSFLKQSWANGYWNILTGRIAGRALALRHFVPLAFSAAILGLALGSLFSPLSAFWLAGLLSVYFAAALVFSWLAVWPKDISYLPFLPVLFFLFHFTYGLGSIWSVIKNLTSASRFDQKPV